MAQKQYNSYATGKKVYSNGSYAPSHGTVDPRGYVKREMTKYSRINALQNKGLDKSQIVARLTGTRDNGGGASQLSRGQLAAIGFSNPFINHTLGPQPSQSRSGHAANAIHRQGNFPTNTGFTGAGKSTLAQGAVGKIKMSIPENNAPVGINPPPSVQASPNGQLDLPYDSQFGWDQLNATNQANQNLLGLQLQEQQQQLQYGQAKRNASQAYDQQRRDTLNSDAARGMAFSSQYGNHVAQNATNYNNFTTDLEAQNQNFLNGIGLQRSQIQSGLADMQRMAALALAERMQNQAGNLGFGQGSADPVGVVPNLGQVKAGTNPVNNRIPYNKPSRISQLKNQGLDKSQIVARLTHTKNNSGGAKKLSTSQLKAIGFSDRFIKSVKGKKK